MDLKDPATGKERTAHVSQLVRFKVSGDGVGSAATRAISTQFKSDESLWDKLEPGHKIIFHIKGEPASYLRVAEVLDYNSEQGKLQVWFYIHAYGEYDVERRLSEWHCTPEWYNNSNVSVVQPKPAAKEKLHKRDGIYSKEDIDLISTGISLQRGRIPAANLIQVDKWLKAASKQDKRALRVVNDGG